MENNILFIIEELGDITSSAAISRFNLCKTVASTHKNCTILTLDNISERVKNEWSNYGNLFVHPKNNIKRYQKPLMYFDKVRGLIYTVLGNNFDHYNRIKNIRYFLKKQGNQFDTIFLLSGGFGFSPHQAIRKFKNLKETKIISFIHDPYPISCYPEPYRRGSKIKDFFKIKNLQNNFTLSNFIVYPSQKLYEWYLNDYQIAKEKVRIIPHAVDRHQVDDKNYIPKNNKVIVHAGTLLEARNPKVFLDVFQKVKLENFEINFYGGINAKVKDQIKIYEPNENINFVAKRIPYKKALEKLYYADFLLLIESNGKNNPFLPTKFVDYVNSGKPIIVLSPKNSEVSRLLGTQYPFVSELDNAEKIEEILMYKIKDLKLLDLANSKIEELKKYFSKENISSLYTEIINN